MQPQAPSRPVILGLLLLYAVSLLINLGIVPLYLEETRRSFITLEMLIRGDWLVATELGEAYTRKPPLFNWVMIPFYKVFGFTEWAPRMITVLSLLGMGGLNWWFVRRHASRELAFWSTALFLIGGDIYFSFSTIGEIDIFYSLVTYASIVAVFHFERAGRSRALFPVVYALSAIGFLTKGLPSILFPAITLTAWYGSRRRWRSLLSLQHLAGLALFALLTGAFFLAYAKRAPLDGYLRDLWTQSSERTVVATGITPVIGHLFSFSLGTLLNILPASLLLPFVFRRGIGSEVKRAPFLLFCAIVLIANAAVYWLSPGSRSRYIYMLFPLMAILLAHAWLSMDRPADPRHRIVRAMLTGLLLLAGGAALILPWTDRIPDLAPYRWIVAATGMAWIVLGGWSLRAGRPVMIALLASVILARIAFDLVVLPLRASTGDIPREKETALEVARIAGSRPLHLYGIDGEGGISFTTVFYLERERMRVLDKSAPGEEGGGDLYIAHRSAIEGRSFETLHSWTWKEIPFSLIRFTDRPATAR